MQIELRYKNIEVRRLSFANVPLDIQNNSTITSVNEEGGNLNVSFIFTSNYEPNVGLIRIEGDLKLEDSKENTTKILNEWKKSGNKNLPENVAENIHNVILANCIVEATILSREVHLPAPIPTPKVSIKKKNDKSDVEVNPTYIR